VKRILRGYRREETERVIAFRSHWGFKSEYYNPASGNEKGGVEGELGWFRRNWLVPVPEASDLCVKVKTNWYSTPLWPGLRVTARVWPSQIEIEHDGKCVARHQRNYGRGHQILSLEHYLDVLEKKPGAMAGSTPLQQWRQAGRWPASMDQIWRKLEDRHGRSRGTKEMIALVRAGLSHEWNKLIRAVEQALSLGVTDSAAIIHILQMPDPQQRKQYAITLAADLAQFEPPQPVMDDYDLLLTTLSGKVVIQ
jgi:hypothetical protein